jgi:endogenous inhibitor of DNA gyrase (YacG/DUF329 family)
MECIPAPYKCPKCGKLLMAQIHNNVYNFICSEHSVIPEDEMVKL